MKRTHRFELLLSDDERNVISACAAATGLTMAAYARQAMMIDQPASARAKAHIVDRAAVVALNSIGSNLNQIAKIANATKTFTPRNLSALTGMYNRLNAIVRQIEGPVAQAAAAK